MFEKIEARLIADWKWVATRTWSVRFMALSVIFEGAGAALPRYETFFSYNIYTVLTVGCTMAALASRFVAQDKDN